MNFALLLDDTVLGVEAVLKVFGVLVGGVLGEQLARGGALEGLEARLALYGLCVGVLRTCEQAYMYRESGNTYRLKLALCLLGPLVRGAIALLLCPAKLLVTPPWLLHIVASYFAPLPMLIVVAGCYLFSESGKV